MEDRYRELIKFIEDVGGFNPEPWAMDYFRFIINKKQFYAYMKDGKIIGYLDYWFFNDGRFAEMAGKNWGKPFPKKISSGDNAYINVAVIDPAFRNQNFTVKFFEDGKKDFPNLKVICWHDSSGKFHKHNLGGKNERNIQQTENKHSAAVTK